MALTLVDEVGSATANTYATLAEYKAYLESRTPTASWVTTALAGTTIDESLKADLIQAQRLMSAAFVWTGSAADEIQALPWPRTGMLNRNGYAILSTVNPNDLKLAQCEYAAQIHDTDVLTDNEAEAKGVRKVKASSVEVEFQHVNLSDPAALDASMSKLNSDFDYTRVPSKVRLLLVPSWYETPDTVIPQREAMIDPIYTTRSRCP